MNNGAFGENFPYSNFHDLNMDWIIKIAKDFLDQYTHIQEVIANGETSLQNLTTSGLEQLQEKADALEALLQQWYDNHSADIANQLATALQDIANTLASTISAFENTANIKAQEALASIPDDYTELTNKVLDALKNIAIINSVIENTKVHYRVKAEPGWANHNYLITDMPMEKFAYYYFDMTFTPAVDGSSYAFLWNNDTNTEIMHKQLQGLSSVSFEYKPTADISSVSLYVSGDTIASSCDLLLSTSKADRITNNNNQIMGIGSELNNVNLLRYDPFIIGGNYTNNFYNYGYMVSSRNPIKALEDMFLTIENGYAISFDILTNPTTISYTVGWKTLNWFIPKGTLFNLRIRKNPLDETAIADIKTYVNAIHILDNSLIFWYDITNRMDKLEVGKTIKLDGNTQTAGNYWWLYSLYDPEFKRIRVKASSQTDTIYEISFFSDYTIAPSTLLQTNSVHIESGYVADVQVHYTEADVPDGCKMICVSSRNILNDNTPFQPLIFADSETALVEKDMIDKSSGLQMFNGYRYVHHAFVENSGNQTPFYIPPQSMIDIDIAYRLGYRAMEFNCHKTATSGVYVCCHGASGKIANELVSRTGEDISNLNFTDVQYETYLNDYIYNTTNPNFRTHITFLDEALYKCKEYNIIPLISLPEGDMTVIPYIQNICGNNFILLVYNDYYLQRYRFLGAFQRFAISSTTTLSQVEELCKKVKPPFLVGIMESYVNTISVEQLKAFQNVVHKCGCLFGSAGVYITTEGNMKLEQVGADYNSTGHMVEFNETGNLKNAHSNMTFSEFDTNGTVSNNKLVLTNNQYISSDIRTNYFLSKAELLIRFKGTIRISMGEKINNYMTTSDGVSAIKFSTFFINNQPDFTVWSEGSTEIYDCDYKVSVC